MDVRGAVPILASLLCSRLAVWPGQPQFSANSSLNKVILKSPLKLYFSNCEKVPQWRLSSCCHDSGDVFSIVIFCSQIMVNVVGRFVLIYFFSLMTFGLCKLLHYNFLLIWFKNALLIHPSPKHLASLVLPILPVSLCRKYIDIHWCSNLWNRAYRNLRWIINCSLLSPFIQVASCTIMRNNSYSYELFA